MSDREYWTHLGYKHGEWFGRYFFWLHPVYYVEAWKSIKRELSKTNR